MGPNRGAKIVSRNDTPSLDGEVYSHLSVAAEAIACLLPTGIGFYAQDGEWWTALRGWLLNRPGGRVLRGRRVRGD